MLLDILKYILVSIIALSIMIAIALLLEMLLRVDRAYFFFTTFATFTIVAAWYLKTPLFFQYKDAVKEIGILVKTAQNTQQNNEQELKTCQADFVSLQANYDSLKVELDCKQANEKQTNQVISELRSELEDTQSELKARELSNKQNNEQNKALLTQLQSEFKAAGKVMSELQPTKDFSFLVECGITPEKVKEQLNKHFLNGIKNGKTQEQKDTLDKYFKKTLKL